MDAYYFQSDKTTVLGATKARLPFSEGKYQLLNSRNTIPFLAVFYPLNFQLPHPNGSNNVSSHQYPLKRPLNDTRKQKTVFKAFFLFFVIGCP